LIIWDHDRNKNDEGVYSEKSLQDYTACPVPPVEDKSFIANDDEQGQDELAISRSMVVMKACVLSRLSSRRK
jgi:hypothetical protein